MLRYLYLIILLNFSVLLRAQNHQQPGNGNPIIPGYFADPTVKKFGDTYYIYATTDGNGGGFGPSQVWMSKDFVNWSLQDMNWPTTHYYWAPDVTKGNDGKYYIYYCQPVEIFGAVGDTPVGPWKSLLPPGKPIVPNFLVPNVITLDGQTFRDDDGKFYMYWGTWGIYPNHGCGVGLLNADMKSFAQLAQIPNTVAKEFFEAPFMFKRNGIYYLTYSSGRCEDGSYRVQYVMSKTGPMGPFVFGKNNPVLSTSADGTIHGPGHQSVLQEGDNFYMVYHRHNNPNSGGGFHRQLVADKMEFDAAGNIVKIKPTHTGIGYLAKNSNPHPNLAFKAKVKASSFYGDDFKPSFAVDDNNGTLWKPKNNTSTSWLELDLGSIKQVKSIHTQFEYATWYYQYIIHYSIDGKTWRVYADRTKNTKHGSPVIDFGDVKARYLKLTITSTEYQGINKAIWNIKVFDNDEYRPNAITATKKLANHHIYKPQGLIVDLNANDLVVGSSVQQWENTGAMKGYFTSLPGKVPVVKLIEGKKAVFFSGNTLMKSNFLAPNSLKGNGSFTVSTWIYNPSIEDEEPIVSWTRRGGIDLSNAGLGYGTNKKWGAATHGGWADMAYQNLPLASQWHHIALVFDGTMEKLYVDGKLQREERKMLFVSNLKEILLGTTTDKNAYFSGALTSLKLYDIPLTGEQVKKIANTISNSSEAYFFDANNLELDTLSYWKNNGYLTNHLKGKARLANVRGIAAAVLGKGDDLLLIATRAFSKLGSFTFLGQLYVDGHAKLYIPSSVPKGKNLVFPLVGTAEWLQVAIIFDGKKYSVYHNGKLMPKSQLTFGTAGEGQFGIKGIEGRIAISKLEVNDKPFSAGQLANSLTRWQIQHPMQNIETSFSLKPKAISPSIIMMTADIVKLPGNTIYYAFTDHQDKLKCGWSEDPQFYDFNLNANQQYGYKVLAKDNFGNITAISNVEMASTLKDQFQIYNGSHGKAHDFLVTTEGTIWDGVIGKSDQLDFTGDKIILASTNTSWDGSPNKGPFLFKEIKGDFIVETETANISGLSEKKVKGANDAGLMVKSLNDDMLLLQNSVMLGWGIGNMVTTMGKNGRLQTNNSSGFSFFSHLQVERTGNLFHLRISEDGLNWKDLPGSPVLRNDLDGQALQVGLFQATYGKQDGFVAFKNFQIFQRK